MLWRTYTPDGRQLEVERTDGGWTAACDGLTCSGENAAEAIAAALGAVGPAIGTSPESVEAWIAEQAAQLEAESA